jgi:hypothetical protein
MKYFHIHSISSKKFDIWFFSSSHRDLSIKKFTFANLVEMFLLLGIDPGIVPPMAGYLL